MPRHAPRRHAVLAAAVLLAAQSTVAAAPVTLCGPGVCYEFDDDAGANPGVTFFGVPTLLTGSDVLEFTPTGFDVEAGGAGGTGSIATTFSFLRISTASGFEIASITAAEFGDYQIWNGGSVSAALGLAAVDLVDDLGTPGFAETTGDTDVFSAVAPTGFALAPWSVGVSIMPAAAFADTASEIGLDLSSALDAATSGADDYAFIATKLALFVSVTGSTTVIPLPAAAWLFASALAGLAAFRRIRVMAA